MALIRLGSLAVEWMRVYAVQRVPCDSPAGGGEKLLIFVDDPAKPLGKPAAALVEPGQIKAAWCQASEDRHFAVFGSIAVDRAKVCAVTRGVSDDEPGSLSFDLGQGRGVTISLSVDAANSILNTIPEPKSTGAHAKTLDYELR